MRAWMIALLLLVLAAAVGALAIFNLNNYLDRNKDLIAQRAASTLGREIDFDELRVSLGGGLGVRLSNLRVGDDPDYSSGPFLRAAAVRVRVKVLPALRGRYEVRSVVLESPSLVIVRSAEGLNLSSLGRSKARGTEVAEKPKDTPAYAAVAIAFADLRNGTVRFIDRSVAPATEITVEGIDFSASDIDVHDVVEFELAAAILGSKAQNLVVKGRVGPVDVESPATTHFSFSLAVDPLSVEELLAMERLGAKRFPALEASGMLRLHAQVGGTAARTEVQGSLDATGASAALPGVVNKPGGMPLRLKLEATRESGELRIASSTLVLDRAELSTSGRVLLEGEAGYELSLETEALPLAGWETVVAALEGLELGGNLAATVRLRAGAGESANPDISGTLSFDGLSLRLDGAPAVQGLSTTATLSGDAIVFSPAEFKIGDSRVRAEARVEGRENPELSFSLNSPLIGAGTLGLVAEGLSPDDGFKEVAIAGTIAQADEGAEFSGRLGSADGQIRGLRYSGLSAALRYKEGRVVVDSLAFAAFGGSFDGQGVYDSGDSQRPAFEFKANARDVDVAALVANGGGGVAEGRLDGVVSLSGRGADRRSIESSLSGGGRFQIRDGLLRDVNIAEGVLTAITGVTGLSGLLSPGLRRKHPALFETGDTEFDALRGRFKISAGRITSDDLLVSAKDYAIRARGTGGLGGELDLIATLVASEALTADLSRAVAEIRHLVADSGRLEIPFKLEGKLPDLRPQVDMEFVAEALQRALLGTVLDRLLGTPETPPNGAQTPPSPPEPGSKSPPAEELILRGLEGLFGP
ncbi:MAG: AsmA family protein [Candidatus Binatia bacterium]